jgi:hypothetical protein
VSLISVSLCHFVPHHPILAAVGILSSKFCEKLSFVNLGIGTMYACGGFFGAKVKVGTIFGIVI